MGQACGTFFKTTSAGGLPKIAKSERACFRVYWVIVTLALYALFAYSLVGSLMHYLSYPKRSVTENTMVESIRLPGITVCDQSAIPARKMAALDNSITRNYTEYLAMAEQLTTCNACDKEEKARLKTLRNDLQTRRGYYQYLKESEVTSLGHGENMILDCTTIQSSTTGHERRTPCEDNVKVTAHSSPDYFTCYEFTLPVGDKREGQSEVSGLEMTLNLDRSPPVNSVDNMPYNPHHETGSGVRVMFHDPDTSYTTNDDFVDLGTGQYGVVTVEISKQESLGPPYGSCGEQDREEGDCSKKVNSECNCTLATDGGKSEKPFCEDLHLGLDRIKSNRECIERILFSEDGSCGRIPRPCESTRYHPTVLTSKWPNSNQLKSFMAFVNESTDYPYGYSASVLGNDGLEQFVADNFVKLQIKKGRPEVVISRQEVAYTLADLFTSIGLMLCIVCGISLFFFFEIIECFLMMCAGSGKPYEVNEK